ncbi:MAG TPA: hypothetical protein VEU30_07345 [Thermoanaerobaculia bacterium]|nr:hypothetical protein [Thermoanaerobaculia bacterium]
MIWKEKRILLIILGLILLANVVFFLTYRVQYQSRLDDLDERLQQAEGRLNQTRAARVKAEQTYRSYKQIEADVAKIYNEYWSTQNARLTGMIAEVKRLTVASSLVPTSVAYQRSEVQAKASRGQRASKESIGATEVGIAFGVSGSYEQIRRLINLLELSRQFVIIDQIGLTQGDGNTLQFNLHIKTLFRDDAAVPPRANNRL